MRVVGLHVIRQIISHIIRVWGRRNRTNRTNNVFVIISMMSPKNGLSAVLNLTFIWRSILFLINGLQIFWNSHVICCLRSCDLKPYWPHNGQVKESCDSETPPPPVTRRNRSLSDEVKMHFDCFDKISSTSKVKNWSLIPDPSRGWGYYGTPTFHSHYDLKNWSTLIFFIFIVQNLS